MLRTKTCLSAVDFGDRLSEMQQRVDDSISTGETVVSNYAFDSIRIASVIRSKGQGALRLGVETHGTLEEITYDADGNRTGHAHLRSRSRSS